MSPRARLRCPTPQLLLRAGVAGVLGVLLASAIAYAAAGIDLLEHAALFPACPFRAATGVPCPGCGMTRALLLASQLDLRGSLAANPAAPFLLAAMAWVGIRGSPRYSRRAQPIAHLALLALLASWALRALVA